MTVSELISELQQCPQNMEVVFGRDKEEIEDVLFGKIYSEFDNESDKQVIRLVSY